MDPAASGRGGKQLVPGLVHDATGGQDVLERQADLTPALHGMEPGGPCLVFGYGNERTTPTTHGALGSRTRGPTRSPAPSP